MLGKVFSAIDKAVLTDGTHTALNRRTLWRSLLDQDAKVMHSVKITLGLGYLLREHEGRMLNPVSFIAS